MRRSLQDLWAAGSADRRRVYGPTGFPPAPPVIWHLAFGFFPLYYAA
ncbi:hypothetical protein Verru16b_01018 [Lacunisphaera limnophila]|uniref:Uncharacterized protein n=1 Tax=Lacunisphaera limnophila TaxID=1838286 RepID=A0A1D8AST5_9BACT|nr:hypothetical protein Verru16b_01018 [Lacunisphaera limnophila]